LLFQSNSYSTNGALTLSGSTLTNSRFDNSLTYLSDINQGTTTTVTASTNVSLSGAGIVLPQYPTYTIGALPTCNAALVEKQVYVTNGLAAPAYLAVPSSTGTSSQRVGCTNVSGTYQWAYGG